MKNLKKARLVNLSETSSFPTFFHFHTFALSPRALIHFYLTFFTNGTLNQTPNNPILVQHFPLWRHDDSICSTKPSDTANAHDRFYVNKPAREAVPAAISKNILEKIKPRIIFSGHTHNWCLREFDRNSVGNGKKMGLKHPLFELSVPSFSWRNRNNPSYLMVSVSDHGIGWQKCFVPRQSTIVGIYVVALLILFFVKL